MSARDELYNIGVDDMPCTGDEVDRAIDNYASEIRAERLSDTERRFLRFALDTVQELIWAGEGFTDDDQAALDSLRRMAEGETE